jgi:DNA-binding XRE family transcriptional regulator
MGQRPRSRPERLAAKLLAVRQRLGVNQTEMAKLLKCESKRLSELESGRREPNLLLLLNYARLARVLVENLIDDDLDLHF